LDEAALLALPWLTEGPFAREWIIRARSFEAFVREVLGPLAAARSAPLRILDLGAGSGWLCHQVSRMGHRAVAVDVRTDAVDGLGAGDGYRVHLPRMFGRVAASFERLPFASAGFDLVVFNASLHYALALRDALSEAARATRRGGRIAVLDSPFYTADDAGEAMVEEKRAQAGQVFGELADVLARPRFVEYLTRARLDEASRGAGGLAWKRVRVRYPLRYELRPVTARLLGRRPPSRFDVWWTEVK
jgi:SAM-dependent methyltransferase